MMISDATMKRNASSHPPRTMGGVSFRVEIAVQALTQIQEQTLIYAPKIIAIFVSLLLFLPLMGALLGGFMRTIAVRIAGM